MAQAAPVLQSSGSGIGNLTSLLQLIKGSSSAQTSTTKGTASDVGINELIKQILAGNQGLASVVSGQKGAGVYNSSTNKLLLNDLITTAAAKGELARAGTTTTQSGKTPGMINGQTVAQLLGLTIGGKILGPSVKKIGTPLDELGQKLSDTFFGGGTGTGVAMETAPASSGIESLAGILGGGSTDLVVGGTGGGDTGATGLAGAGSEALTGTSAIEAAFGSQVGAASMGTAASSAAALEAFGSGGTAAGLGTAAEVGGTAAVAGESAGIGELIAAAAAAWIICTELLKQERLPKRWYIYGSREFASYDERGKQGYYIWAIPCVKHLREHPNSLFSKVLEWTFNHRAEYLASIAGCSGARDTIIGAAITHGLYGFCWVLSRTIARTPIDWTVVYRGV